MISACYRCRRLSTAPQPHMVALPCRSVCNDEHHVNLPVHRNLSQRGFKQLLCRYDSDDTPMSFYLNVHETLENRRKEADDEGKGHGPRTIVSFPCCAMHISYAGSAAVLAGLGCLQLAVLAGVSFTAT